MTTCPPYRPVRGARPPHFVDRPPAGAVDGAGLVASCVAGLRNGPDDPRCRQLVTADPGMGKSAFCSQLAACASAELGWSSVVVQCRPKQAVLGALAERISALLPGAAPLPQPSGPGCSCREAHPAGQRLRPVPPVLSSLSERSWDHLSEVVTRAARKLADMGQGLLLVLDDADGAVGGEAEGMACMARTLQARSLPVACLLTASEAAADRWQPWVRAGGPLWHERLGAMHTEECAEALVVPAAERGARFELAALDLMCEFAAGSPLGAQRAGFVVWPTLGERGIVTGEGARCALELVGMQARSIAS